MEFFDQRIDKTVLATADNIINTEFACLTYTEAIDLLEKSSQKFEYPVEWGVDLQSEHERYLAEDVFKRPTIVTDYPKDIKAFYMRLNDDGKTVAAMDILAPKIGEIIGGSQREERLEVLRQRIQEQGIPESELWWYLDLRRYGSVPHAGFGLGFERIVQFMTGMGNIRDVIPFPRTPMNAEF
jgi:asparaginyl-tRNA synthetase